MTASILHRVTGDGMATVGAILFVWWLAALAGGAESYGYFWSWFSGSWAILGYVLAIGLTWAFFQHLLSGLRHLVMDTGAGFELRSNKRSAMLTFVGSVVLTAAFWAWQLRDLYLGGGK